MSLLYWLFVLQFYVAYSCVGFAFVFYTYAEAWVDEHLNVTSCRYDGESFVEDLKASSFKGEGASIVSFTVMLYTKNFINVYIWLQWNKKRGFFSFDRKFFVEGKTIFF